MSVSVCVCVRVCTRVREVPTDMRWACRHIVFMLHMLCLLLASAICAVAASSPLPPGSRIIVVSSVLAKQQQRGKTFSTVVHNARDSLGAART